MQHRTSLIFGLLLINAALLTCKTSDADDEDDDGHWMIDMFLDFADGIVPGSAKFLGDIFSSPVLNECPYRCPNSSKLEQADQLDIT